jgi:hypothetical protein
MTRKKSWVYDGSGEKNVLIRIRDEKVHGSRSRIKHLGFATLNITIKNWIRFMLPLQDWYHILTAGIQKVIESGSNAGPDPYPQQKFI